MNRPLKFKVWNKKSNEWCGTIGLNETISHNELEYDTDDLVFVQYTGLTDSKDKEICEGDIIKEHHFEDWGDTVGYEYRGVVRYKMYDTSDVNRKFSGFITFPNELENKNYSGNPIHSDCEVIGNIFEHKHLLEK